MFPKLNCTALTVSYVWNLASGRQSRNTTSQPFWTLSLGPFTFALSLRLSGCWVVPFQVQKSTNNPHLRPLPNIPLFNNNICLYPRPKGEKACLHCPPLKTEKGEKAGCASLLTQSYSRFLAHFLLLECLLKPEFHRNLWKCALTTVAGSMHNWPRSRDSLGRK